jgi:hypothetical protein
LSTAGSCSIEPGDASDESVDGDVTTDENDSVAGIWARLPFMAGTDWPPVLAATASSAFCFAPAGRRGGCPCFDLKLLPGEFPADNPDETDRMDLAASRNDVFLYQGFDTPTSASNGFCWTLATAAVTVSAATSPSSDGLLDKVDMLDSEG